MRCNYIRNISFIFVLVSVVSKSAFSYFITVDETKFHLVKSYLCRYGYMNENVCKQHADDSLKFMQNNARDIYRGLVIFQTMFNITRSGKIDEDTIMKMAKPRCGNKDFDLQFSSSKFLSFRTNDYSLLRKGLRKLTYSIKKYNPYLNRFSKSLSNEAVETLVEKAFNTWLKHLHGDVRVQKLNDEDEIYENSNITIYFAEGNHGDSMLFDGIDGELAHSCSLSNTQSPYRGHVHLDDSENWSKGNRLLAVLMHEIGHLFGLDHSSNPKSIMSPLFYFGSEEILEEDVKNLRMILGLESKHKHFYQSTSTPTTLSKTSENSPSTTEFTKSSTVTTSSPTTPTTPTTTSKSTTVSTTVTESTITTTEKSTTETTTFPTSTITTTDSTTTLEDSEEEEEIEEETTAESTIIQMSTAQMTTTGNLESENNQDIEEETENDTTAEIIINTNSEELKPVTESLIATTRIPDSITANEQQTDVYHVDDEIASSTRSSFSNENHDESDEEYTDELTLVTTSEPIMTTTQSFLTSLLDSALLQLNRTNHPTTEPTVLINSTNAFILTTTLNNITEVESEEESEETEDKTNESEFQELIKLIGTTSSNFITKQDDSPITTSTLSSLSSEVGFGDEGENEDISEKTTTAQVVLATEDEYFTSADAESNEENQTVSSTVIPYKPTTSYDLVSGEKKTDNLTSFEKLTSEEPIEVQSTQESAIQSTPEMKKESTIESTITQSTTIFLTSQNNQKNAEDSSLVANTTLETEEEPADLCNDPEIDAITRTEWGNALIFKGNYIWHIRGLTKWRLFDYEGWPKKISTLFPGLPSNIDTAYLFDDLYHFTKNQTIWKYKVVLSYPPKYVLVQGYPKLLKDEYPDMPFKSVDSAFSIASSIFFFKDYEFWQSDWNSNVTGKIPFKTNAAVSWRNPRLDNSLTEPLAYIVSNSSLYKFNYWSIPISQEALDIRYFLFDCVQANYKPHNPLFLGPSYKQAFIADDVYNRESRLSARHAPAYLARLTRNSNDKNSTENHELHNVLIKNFYSKSTCLKSNLSILSILLSFVFAIF